VPYHLCAFFNANTLRRSAVDFYWTCVVGMADETPRQEFRTVGGCLPSSASRSRGTPEWRAVPPAHFAIDALDTHNGPIMSSSSPVVSRRRSQPPSTTTTPGTSITATIAREMDPYADLRASKAALAMTQPGRLTANDPDAVPAAASTKSADYDDGDELVEEAVPPLPQLPRGRMMMVNCLTNYGDPHFIGFAGIELFDDRGRRVEVRPSHIFGSVDSAPPSGGCGVVASRPFNTTDEEQMWLVPYTEGEAHVLILVFEQEASLSLIRLWNYNHGRVHTTRGARLVEITLDDRIVFRGEVQQATGSGTAEDASMNSETLVLSDDADVLALVAEQLEQELDQELIVTEKPTAATLDSELPVGFMSVSHVLGSTTSDLAVPLCASISLEFLSTWGNEVVVGLSAIRVLDADGEDIDDLAAALEVAPEFAGMFEADRDGSSAGVANGGATPLSALFDADPQTAWFARMVPGLRLRLDFPRPTRVSALLLANAGIFDVSCGARHVRIYRDRETVLADELVLRKAPACLKQLLFQTIRLSDLLADAEEGATTRTSVTARGAVGLRRAVMMNQPWPEFYADVAPDVALLPVGYAFVVEMTVIETLDRWCSPSVSPDDRGARAANLIVHAIEFTDESMSPGAGYFASIPTARTEGGDYCFENYGVPGKTVLFVSAYDQPRCLHALTMRVEAPEGCAVDVTVLVDDVPVFQGTVATSSSNVVVPFTRDRAFLLDHRQQLYFGGR
jgi:hypothetical protein